jgi:3D (Asp-Asp-Asp) domain-containing protein
MTPPRLDPILELLLDVMPAAVLVVAALVLATLPAQPVVELAPLPSPSTSSAPAAVPTPPPPPRPSPARHRAARHRATPPAGTGELLSSTAYCLTGTMADGTRVDAYPAWTVAAGNRWPLGTRLYVVELGITVRIRDRIGHGSDLDLALPGDCPAADRYGRRAVHVRRLS